VPRNLLTERKNVKRAIFFAACLLVTSVRAQAQTTGMDALTYYAGTWKCSAGDVGKTPDIGTVVGAFESGVLKQAISIPRQHAMKQAYGLVITTTYDPKRRRYYEANVDNQGYWEISVAKPWTGKTENWTDIATADGKLGHSTTVRTSADNYDNLTSTKPSFRGTCTHSP
jgi:hypothetical protein